MTIIRTYTENKTYIYIKSKIYESKTERSVNKFSKKKRRAKNYEKVTIKVLLTKELQMVFMSYKKAIKPLI